MTLFRKGDRVRPNGYMPATVVTGNLNRCDELQVEFAGGSRRWFRYTKLQIVVSVTEVNAMRDFIDWCAEKRDFETLVEGFNFAAEVGQRARAFKGEQP